MEFCSGCDVEINIITNKTWYPALSGIGNMCGKCIGSREQLKIRQEIKDTTKEIDLRKFEEEHLFDHRLWNSLLSFCAFHVTWRSYKCITLLEIYRMTEQYCKLQDKVSHNFLQSLQFPVGEIYYGVDPEYIFSGCERKQDDEFGTCCTARYFPLTYEKGRLVFRPGTKLPWEAEFYIFGDDFL